MDRIPFEADHNAFLTEVYYLLASFLASRPIAGLSASPPRPLAELASFPLNGMIANRLIGVASLVRAKSDDGSWSIPEGAVGDLYDLPTPTSTSCPLLFREACNKIMHATAIHYDMSRDEKTNVQYLNPVLYLYGSRDNREWKAVLRIIDFCDAAQKVIF